jgi:MFS transporter, DHA3 family, macrolide efflux protein
VTENRRIADPITTVETELEPTALPDRERAGALLRRRDFRRVYAAIAVSVLGDSFQYIALMWVALVTAGPLGVLAVRLADSIPALVFGFHGGLVADRLDRRRTMVAADLVRALVLVPVAIAGLAHHLPIWGLVIAAFTLEAATSYFEPAYGALLPMLVERRNVQAANGLVNATAQALSVGGWGIAAALLLFLPVSAFFAMNALSFVASALLLSGVRVADRERGEGAAPRIRECFEALRPRPALAVAIATLGVGVTISSGTWIVGVPQLVRQSLHRGAGSFSLIAAAYAVGSVIVGVLLTRVHVRRKEQTSFASWSAYLPGYGLFAITRSLAPALAGAACDGCGQSSARVLVNSAAQEQIPDQTLGRVMGLVSLVHRGAHATGLLVIAPLFVFLSPRAVFAGAAIAIPLVGIAGAVSVRVIEARADATVQSRRS